MYYEWERERGGGGRKEEGEKGERKEGGRDWSEGARDERERGR